ncbi:MAG: NupC/NupG family nucleoside CNT transporter [Acidobacteriaceae bacterium]|nr:NupC/NupG family nucleoside CNT transporter [Acidobacteriaceae bacterium]MBV9296203.1 NupC/NupG family nucleoside CNT transporter [Acidobacteriaceae bacterium]MBV9764069.1 NupC/NupG family nucleoside CNT transporter [Acidobacteriaceae bacterium]
MARLDGLVGLICIVLCAYLFSTRRSAIQKRILLWGIVLQFALAFLVLKTKIGNLFYGVSLFVNALLNYTAAGSSFVFGEKLGLRNDQFGVIFAFQVLPIVIFICSLFAILYYLGVMQVFVKGMAVFMQKFMRTSGAESTCVAASIVMGQTEAPVTIRPFLETLTESELFTVMVSGMAHVSGSVMAAYVAIAGVSITHLLTAVIMTAPATIMLSKMFVPETGEPVTAGTVKVEIEKPGVNLIDAAARGAGDGLYLALNIAGMLIAFLALIAMINGGLGWAHSYVAWIPASLQQILAIVFAPVAWALGVSWNDCATIGNLLGTRMVLNEFVAFVELAKVKAMLAPRSFVIATFALCGFANLSSIAIQIGGIGALAPSRKSDLARLGFKAMLVGTLANFMSACIAGILL